ncbi:hypothetical protein ABEP46_12295 [Cutibacterium acnes]
MSSNNPVYGKVTFTKGQLALLEQLFGTYESLSKEITIDSNLVLLNRKAGQQDVLNAVRERTVGQ